MMQLKLRARRVLFNGRQARAPRCCGTWAGVAGACHGVAGACHMKQNDRASALLTGVLRPSEVPAGSTGFESPGHGKGGGAAAGEGLMSDVQSHMANPRMGRTRRPMREPAAGGFWPWRLRSFPWLRRDVTPPASVRSGLQKLKRGEAMVPRLSEHRRGGRERAWPVSARRR